MAVQYYSEECFGKLFKKSIKKVDCNLSIENAVSSNGRKFSISCCDVSSCNFGPIIFSLEVQDDTKKKRYFYRDEHVNYQLDVFKKLIRAKDCTSATVHKDKKVTIKETKESLLTIIENFETDLTQPVEKGGCIEKRTQKQKQA